MKTITRNKRSYLSEDLIVNTWQDIESYFEELLARIRDIRSSEKVFWRKVLDIYATSIDYDPKSESSILFFKYVRLVLSVNPNS